MDILNSIIEFLNKGVFSAFSNVSSIVGLIISIFVLIRIKRIERNYILRFRVPTLISKIEEHALNLANCLNDYPNFVVDIKVELAKSRAHLESLHGKVDRRTKKTINSLLEQVQRYSESGIELENLPRAKLLLYRLGLRRLRNADQQELRGDKKRDAIYSIYENMLTLTEEIKNTQEDRRLD